MRAERGRGRPQRVVAGPPAAAPGTSPPRAPVPAPPRQAAPPGRPWRALSRPGAAAERLRGLAGCGAAPAIAAAAPSGARRPAAAARSAAAPRGLCEPGSRAERARSRWRRRGRARSQARRTGAQPGRSAQPAGHGSETELFAVRRSGGARTCARAARDSCREGRVVAAAPASARLQLVAAFLPIPCCSLELVGCRRSCCAPRCEQAIEGAREKDQGRVRQKCQQHRVLCVGSTSQHESKQRRSVGQAHRGA